jgi:hypothetical protein
MILMNDDDDDDVVGDCNHLSLTNPKETWNNLRINYDIISGPRGSEPSLPRGQQTINEIYDVCHVIMSN